MRALIYCFSLVLSILFTLPSLAAPRDPYDLPEPVAIQGRKYQMSQSLYLSVGYLPIDSFNKGFGFSGGYRYAFTPYLTWEVINYTQVANRETQLKQDLEALDLDVKNVGLGGVLDFPKQIMMTGLHYAPFYSKSLMFNSTLVYSESSLFFGAGTLNFNKVGIKPMVAPGLANRTYISRNSAVNLYFRSYFYNDDNTGITNIFEFGIGFEYGFQLLGGGSSRGGDSD